MASLEQRRNRLRTMLQEERERLEAELRGVVPDRSSAAGQLVQKTEELRTAREERRKQVVAFKQNLFVSADHGSTLPYVYKSCSFLSVVSLACTRAAKGALEDKQHRVARGS